MWSIFFFLSELGSAAPPDQIARAAPLLMVRMDEAFPRNISGIDIVSRSRPQHRSSVGAV